MPRDQGETPEELKRDAESMELLEHGGLPLTATRRIKEAREAGGTWSSDLSVAELASIRGVGFDPVGLVMGTSVYHIGYQYGQTFGYGWRPPSGVIDSFPCQHGWYHEGQAAGYNWENAFYAQALGAARELAMERMEKEAEALGAHGVVGLRVRHTRGAEWGGHVEFFAVGTAIVRRGAPLLPSVFTSHLSGQDFAKLMRTGYVPARFVAGIGAIQVQRGCMMEWQERMSQNTEIEQFSLGAQKSRQLAVRRLEEQVAKCGQGVVGVESTASSHLLGGAELLEVQVTGTAVRRFATEPMPAEPLRMLRLRSGE
jgi:uncharacterized protein YbjQ (UPF0145 family)